MGSSRVQKQTRRAGRHISFYSPSVRQSIAAMIMSFAWTFVFGSSFDYIASRVVSRTVHAYQVASIDPSLQPQGEATTLANRLEKVELRLNRFLANRNKDKSHLRSA